MFKYTRREEKKNTHSIILYNCYRINKYNYYFRDDKHCMLNVSVFIK